MGNMRIFELGIISITTYVDQNIRQTEPPARNWSAINTYYASDLLTVSNPDRTFDVAGWELILLFLHNKMHSHVADN